ncbi:MAG: putative rane protein [Bryobacterales bacterium]|nr:putative rane protein [Bryobacterales bacterium]
MPPEFVQWLQNAGLATAIRESAIVYPVILSLHLTGMALFGGMILMTDLRLLGIAMTKRPVSEVVEGLRPWKHLGLTLVVTCGFLLAWSKIAIYYPNPFFRLKLGLLTLVTIHALVFRRSVYRNTRELDRSPVIPGRAKLAAALSLVLWIGLVSAGRWIGYWEPKAAAPPTTAQVN